MTTNMKRLFPILRRPANFGYKMRFYRSSFLYKLIFSIPWCQFNYPECSSIYLDGQNLQMSNVQDNFSFVYCDTCTYVIMSHVHGRYAHIHHLSVQTHVLHNMVAFVFNINGGKHVHNAQYGNIVDYSYVEFTFIMSHFYVHVSLHHSKSIMFNSFSVHFVLHFGILFRKITYLIS
jgi:hypothetical protein